MDSNLGQMARSKKVRIDPSMAKAPFEELDSTSQKFFLKSKPFESRPTGRPVTSGGFSKDPYKQS